MITKISVCWICLLLTVKGFAVETPLLSVDFNDVQPEQDQNLNIATLFEKLKWQSTRDAKIVDTNHERQKYALQVMYPKAAVGPKYGGAQFAVELTPSEELWLSYQVYFKPGFDFRLGGKLPGLTSGGSKYTGGNIPTEGQGWSARYMWKKQGLAVIYLYYMDMPGKWGENIFLNEFRFTTGKWYTLVQRIKVNELGKANGELDVWINQQAVLSRKDIRFRGQKQALIDTFYFSTFHGGNTAKWGPKNDSYALFDNIVVSRGALVAN